MESDSIRNQRELIMDYLGRHPDIRQVKEYVDDGYSGTSFERPAFLEMLSDIEAGKINCILVKDLSRFGRNYIETGRYLEHIFPAMGVRFISITDQYDNARKEGASDQIILPFKNLLNEAYCRDISVKVRSHLDIKRKNGKFIGSFACYGYRKAPDDKNSLIVDEYAAEIVRTIYQLRLDGMSAGRIAQKLDELGVLPPMEYKRRCGLNYQSGFRMNEEQKWAAKTILRILENEVYTGTLVQGKRKKVSFKVAKCHEVDPEQWIRVPHTHEAIISQEMFDQVQLLKGRDTLTPSQRNSVYPLSGYIYCGRCGQNMIVRPIRKKTRSYRYYYCITRKSGGGCDVPLIGEDQLLPAILREIKKQIARLLDAEEIMKEVQEPPKDRYNVTLVNEQLKQQTVELERYQELKLHLFEDLQDGIISREELEEMKESFESKIKRAKEEREKLEQKKEQLLTQQQPSYPWLEEFRKYKNVCQLNRRMVVALINRIVVYDKGRFEIQYRFEQEISDLLQCAEYYRNRQRREMLV